MRRFTLSHPCGKTQSLPLLIPSFSSKGFGYYRLAKGRPLRSIASYHLGLAGPSIRGSLLISAYDIHFELIDAPISTLSSKSLVFVDSGGYELSPEYDGADTKHFEYRPRKGYGLKQYEAVLHSLPRSLPCVIANFDWATRLRSIPEQADAARDLFGKYPEWLGTFLLKPGSDRRRPISFVRTTDVAKHIEHLRHFAIIGFTERDLGPSVLDRVNTLRQLRTLFDAKGLEDTPIHIWGCLDPLVAPLYFLAGASLFDGVSWLRYGFSEGVLLGLDDASLLSGDYVHGAISHQMVFARNLAVLSSLESAMSKFVERDCQDFGVFGANADRLSSLATGLFRHSDVSSRAKTLRRGALH